MAVKLLILQNCREDESDSLPLHIVPKQDTDRCKNLLPADPLKELILILKMIIKCDADHAGAVCDLLDGNLLYRLLKRKFLEALGEKRFHFSFLLHWTTSGISLEPSYLIIFIDCTQPVDSDPPSERRA